MKKSAYLLKVTYFLIVNQVFQIKDLCINQLISITREIYNSFNEAYFVGNVFVFQKWKVNSGA